MRVIGGWARMAGVLIMVAAMAHANAWDDLWWTRDQQAQRLLDQKQPAQAASLFEDARRRGYAQLKAGHYAEAAKLLAGTRDADSQYNRGNALAHTGQLQDALQAYDAALAAAPGDRDIRKNRDLVKTALEKKRTSQPQSSSGNGADQKNGHQGDNQQGQRGGGATTGRGQSRNAGESQSSGQTGQGAGAMRPDNAASNGSNGSAQSGNRLGNDGAPGTSRGGQPPSVPRVDRAPAVQQAGVGKQSPVSPSGAPAMTPQTPAGEQTGAGDRASQAAATASDRDSVRNEVSGSLQSSNTKNPMRAPRQPRPPSEQNLALDQWLRTIPDDPGELLQRKFMIEHLMKQKDTGP
jgi:Ca-activated chloride channel homolog